MRIKKNYIGFEFNGWTIVGEIEKTWSHPNRKFIISSDSETKIIWRNQINNFVTKSSSNHTKSKKVEKPLVSKNKMSKHGMTPEQARKVKLAGHKNEDIVADYVNGQVLGGKIKGDVIDEKNEILSVKTGTKTQWALYCRKTMIDSDWTEKQKKSLEQYIDFLPDSKEEYKSNKIKYKKNYFVKGLYEAFMDEPMKLVKFFCGYGEVDAFHLTDVRDNRTYRISSEIFFNKLENSIKRIYTTPGGKLVIAGGPKNIILFEMELRKGTNHKNTLFHSHLSRIIDVLK